MDRTPRRRQASRFTRGSVSTSSQRTICPEIRHCPENPEFGSRRTPGSGTIIPVEARQTMALSCANATATPSAPVIASALSATSCSTSSKTNCSSWKSSPGSESLSVFARRVRICSCNAEKARRACSASCPMHSVGDAARSPGAGTASVSSFINSKSGLLRLVLMTSETVSAECQCDRCGAIGEDTLPQLNVRYRALASIAMSWKISPARR